MKLALSPEKKLRLIVLVQLAAMLIFLVLFFIVIKDIPRDGIFYWSIASNTLLLIGLIGLLFLRKWAFYIYAFSLFATVPFAKNIVPILGVKVFFFLLVYFNRKSLK